MVREAFERAAADGELRPDVDCAAAARTLIALMDGLQVQWLLRPDEVDIAGDLRRCLQPLLVDRAAPAGLPVARPRHRTKTDRAVDLFWF